MIILITGASHTGKTLLAQKLLEKYHYPYLSIDHLKMGLIRSGQTDLTPYDDDKLTDYLWSIIKEMIKTAIENKQNLIVEGCYIPFNWKDSFDEEYLSQLSGQIATTINRANVYAEILKHATLDALTGFYNRRQLEERIKQEVSNAKRQNAPLCGIMTDIDFFKSVNDTYGHAVGDLVLKTIAKVIRSQLLPYGN